MSETEIWIDNLGVLYIGSNPVGYYDELEDICYLNDGTITPCPEIKDIIEIPIVTAKQTYWWALLAGFVVLVVFLGWFLNRKK